jgi:hypothetical protein
MTPPKFRNKARLERKLKRLPEHARTAICKVMEEIATEIVQMAKRLTRSKRVADSIGWTWGDVPSGSMSLGEVEGGSASGSLRITIYAGNDEAFFARWEEFGTKARPQGGAFAGTDHPGTTAHPYFYPAYRTARRKAKRKIQAAIRKAAKQTAAMG